MKTPSLALLALTLSLSACTAISPVHEPTKATAMTHTNLVSPYDFNTTVSRLKSAIQSKGMTVFATIDHAKAAQDDGMTMQPATVIIYGSPKAGTPLMKKDPAFALALPLKVLIIETDGQVQVIYTPANELIKGSQIQPSDVEDTLANAEKLIRSVLQ